jgi:hypothetical protein
MNGTTPANVTPNNTVGGMPEIDIVRAGSALNDQTLTLFMQLKGDSSPKARYYFLVRTTGAGSIWGMYDIAMEFTNSSATIYFATTSSYQNLSDARSFDMNASITRKPSELYAYVRTDLLRNPQSFQLTALAFMRRDNATSYADWTKGAKVEGEGSLDIGAWLLPIIGITFMLLVVSFYSMRGGEASGKDQVVCKTCGRRFSKDLLYCPNCGRETKKEKKS